MGAMRAIFEAGLKIPDDIALAGAGNIHYSALLAVPLTSVDQGTSETGRRAAELLLAQIASRRIAAPTEVLIMPKLVVRQSTLRRVRV